MSKFEAKMTPIGSTGYARIAVNGRVKAVVKGNGPVEAGTALETLVKFIGGTARKKDA